MRVLLNRLEQNEQRMNSLCQRLAKLDPAFQYSEQSEPEYTDEERKIIEDVRRECKASSPASKV